MASSLLQQTVAPRWVPRAVPEQGVAEALGIALSLPATVCNLLAMRGYNDPEVAKRYLKPRLEELHDPFLLAGMHAAVDRITKAIKSNERILVHGDYDVDGSRAPTL